MGITISAIFQAIFLFVVISFLWVILSGILRVFLKKDQITNSRYLKWIYSKNIFLILIILCIGYIPFYLWASFKNEGDFYKWPGAGDYWRIPLIEPYEISIIDVFDQGGLQNAQSPSQGLIVSNISKYILLDSALIGITRTKGFVFELKAPSEHQVYSIDKMDSILNTYGKYDLKSLKTIRENYDIYWD